MLLFLIFQALLTVKAIRDSKTFSAGESAGFV